MASHILFPLLLDIVHRLGVIERQFATYDERELAQLLASSINAHPQQSLRELYQFEWMIKNLRESIERARQEGRFVRDEEESE